MVDLLDGYADSSCVIKVKSNDLINMGALHCVDKSFIDVGSSRNELLGTPYNLPIKLEIYNTQPGSKVPMDRVYLSPPKLVRIVKLSETTNDECREYSRISARDEGIIYNCIRGNGTLDMREEPEDYNGPEVRLADINLGGLIFCIGEEFKINDCSNIVIPTIGDPMLFICEIRRRVDHPEGSYGYDYELVEVATKQEDLLYWYILRRQGDQLWGVR